MSCEHGGETSDVGATELVSSCNCAQDSTQKYSVVMWIYHRRHSYYRIYLLYPVVHLVLVLFKIYFGRFYNVSELFLESRIVLVETITIPSQFRDIFGLQFSETFREEGATFPEVPFGQSMHHASHYF
jgi:hypothetical protein